MAGVIRILISQMAEAMARTSIPSLRLCSVGQTSTALIGEKINPTSQKENAREVVPSLIYSSDLGT